MPRPYAKQAAVAIAVNTRLPDDLYQHALQLAEYEERSMNQMLVRLIRHGLKTYRSPQELPEDDASG